jgi:hypothetical protein
LRITVMMVTVVVMAGMAVAAIVSMTGVVIVIVGMGLAHLAAPG